MKDEIQKKQVIESIRKEMGSSKGTHIWGDYVNALKLISQVVFTRSSGFILEIIQNAEDAGIGLEGPGEFEIKINKERVMISHETRRYQLVKYYGKRAFLHPLKWQWSVSATSAPSKWTKVRMAS